jgi:hypothetical protein
MRLFRFKFRQRICVSKFGTEVCMFVCLMYMYVAVWYNSTDRVRATFIDLRSVVRFSEVLPACEVILERSVFTKLW